MAIPDHGDGRADRPRPDALLPAVLGTATLHPAGRFEAGCLATFELTYTAGPHGIDDSGALRICFRFASDQGRPQFDAATEPNYTTVRASNGARLEYRFIHKGNVRPWDRTIEIKVIDGFLREGDTITVTFGDRSGGSPGLRLQTFCEDSFEFRVLVDPIATYNFQPLPEQPTIRIVPGPPVRFLATVPTLARPGQAFDLRFKGEDRWGNPSDKCNESVTVECDGPLRGAPPVVYLRPGDRRETVTGLAIDRPGDYRLTLRRTDGSVLAVTNPLRIADVAHVHAWGDLHGQSEETIGTNSAAEYFAFARDLAFLDATGHQGNDFQIANDLWDELNRQADALERPGRFAVLPGYEWSGNTTVGGDRNVYYPTSDRKLRRSSHALVDDKSDIGSDCRHARDLFAALAKDGDWSAVVFAHCGGRYADLHAAHDGRFEKSVEIHSSWGTFDWILHDAFEIGARLGIVANSDGHKGRPGASYPGASLFGAIGGLTCFHLPTIGRDEIMACLRRRHHYATSGGPNGRLFLSVTAHFATAATVYEDDPKVCPNDGRPACEAMMGDIVHLPTGDADIRCDISAGAPIERIELFNGRQLIETIRPGTDIAGSRRLQVTWSGARYRGRFRQVIWDGTARLDGNRIVGVDGINFFNPDKTAELLPDGTVQWRSLTTGNMAGIELSVAEPASGILEVETGPVRFRLPLRELGDRDRLFDVDGPLPRFIRVTRLPEEGGARSIGVARTVAIGDGRDNPVYVRVTLEDGTIAWSSPIYLFRG